MSRMAFFREGRPESEFVEFSGGRYASTLPRIVCADGFSVSVQAGALLYSRPRDDYGPWTLVEVGYPSERPEPWHVWKLLAEDPDRPTGTVYGYVPLRLVEELIERHGGERR